MDLASYNLLARSGFAGDQNTHVSLGDLLNQRIDDRHRRIGTDKFAVRPRRSKFSPQALVLRSQHLSFDRVSNQEPQFIDIEGLRKVVIGSELDSLNGHAL